MKKTLAAAAAVALATGSIAVAAPAQAYDKDAYVYAAGHMLQSRDLPKALGDFGKNMSFNASQDSEKIYLCFVSDTEYRAPAGDFTFGAFFFSKAKGDNGNSISQTVTQYPTAMKAITAFRTLTKQAKNCTGSSTQTWTDDDGSTQTSSSLNTNGKVPMVTEVGVESVFVNQNYLSTSSTGSDRYASDTYTVYTLLNDVILATAYSTGSLENIPTAQRKKVNELAFTAIERWLD